MIGCGYVNNKGFAITSLIYGLAIMGFLLIVTIMATLSSTRRSIKEISNSVEQDLLNAGKSSFVYTSSSIDQANEFIIPSGEGGLYRVELWGAGGGDPVENSCSGKPGSYVTGVIYLNDGDKLYSWVGPCGNTSRITFSNDGGNTNLDPNKIIMQAGRGGTEYSGGTVCFNKPDEDYKTINGITSCAGSNVLNSSLARDADVGTNSFISGNPVIGGSMVGGRYFVDGYMMSGANKGPGKVAIQKINSGNDLNSFRSSVWNNVGRVNLEVEGNNESKCSVTYSSAGNISSTVNSNLSIINVDDLTLICDESIVGKNVKIEFGSNVIFDGKYYNNGLAGIKLSAYQTFSRSSFPEHGNYYIIPVNSNGKVFTAANDPDVLLKLNSLLGQNRQKFSIDSLGDSKYRLIESSKFRAMDIFNDENIIGNDISTKGYYNTVSDIGDQKWNIQKNYDGTFSIKTPLPPMNHDNKNSGYITASGNDLKIGEISASGPTTAQKYFIYSIDYGR